MRKVQKYYVTFREGDYFGTYAIVYAENSDKAFSTAQKEFGVDVMNTYTEFNWKTRYTEHLRFLKEINPEYLSLYNKQRSKRSKVW